ncbi:MAG: FMN-binding protein [Actinobacteria bacterium]|nr:FMN-binding protein [Actinomycetota bacterium]
MSSDNSSPTSRFALARRLAPALALTSAGVALINVLDRPVNLSASGSAGVADIGSSADSGAGQMVTGATVPAPTTTTVTTTTVVATTVPSVNGAPPDTTPTPSPAACGAKKSTGSTTDIVDRNRVFGTLVVTAKFASNGELCGVAVNFDVWDRKSVQIEQYALPKLNARAKKAKSANIQGISGATAVSRAYAASLQAAIDAKPL